MERKNMGAVNGLERRRRHGGQVSCKNRDFSGESVKEVQ